MTEKLVALGYVDGTKFPNITVNHLLASLGVVDVGLTGISFTTRLSGIEVYEARQLFVYGHPTGDSPPLA